jgi:Holliday junction DNA helicase RuvA
MISFLKGDIVEINVDYVLIDVNGVGFQVFVGKPQDFSYGRSLIYTYYHVKEDGVSLYGFKTKQEQDLFLRLINVSGIGPKTASGILGATTTNSLISAIELGNIAFLKKLPSIGPKAAQQIVLDLKGKLEFIGVGVSDDIVDTSRELEEVLIGLGYKEKEIKPILARVDTSLSIEDQVKDALKLLLK